MVSSVRWQGCLQKCNDLCIFGSPAFSVFLSLSMHLALGRGRRIPLIFKKVRTDSTLSVLATDPINPDPINPDPVPGEIEQI